MIFEKAIQRCSECYSQPFDKTIFENDNSFKELIEAYRFDITLLD